MGSVCRIGPLARPDWVVTSALGAPKDTASSRRDGYSVLGLSTTPSHSPQPASASIADARRAINSAVQLATATPTASSWVVDGFTFAGLTLSAMERLDEKAERKRKEPGPPSTMRQGGSRKAGECLTTADVCFEIVRPATEQRKCAYVELESAVLPGEIGRADAFVSHAWLFNFAELVSALKAAKLPPDTRFWVDVAVVNQHVNATRGFDWWSTTFRGAIESIGLTLLVLAPWRAPVPLRRAWCVWEIFCTVDTQTKLRVLLPQSERSAFVEALMRNFEAAATVVSTVDVTKAEAHSAEDLANISDAVMRAGGAHTLNVAAAGGLREAFALAGKQVLEERRVVGDEAFELASQLATMLMEQGKYGEARPMYEHVLAVRERTLGAEHESTLATMNNLANLLSCQGDLAAAREMFERMLAVEERKYGQPMGNLWTTANLAIVLRQQGDYAAAREMQESVLEVMEITLGAEHRDTLAVMGNLAIVLENQGDYAAARGMQERVLKGTESTLGAEHPHTLATMGNLAGLLDRQGDYAAAREMQERVLKAQERTLGTEHMATLATMNALAIVLMEQGDLATAQEMLERTLTAQERTLAAEHPSTLNTMGNLATLLLDQGKHAEARDRYHKILQVREQAFGAVHPHTLLTLVDRAEAQRRMGEATAAEADLRRALAGLHTALGGRHQFTLYSVATLSLVLVQQGRTEEAAAVYADALQGESLGLQMPITMKNVDALSQLLRERGDGEAAERLREQFGCK